MYRRILTISVFSLSWLWSFSRAEAQRPTYSVTEATPIDVDPPGVSCAASPGSCFKVHYVTSTSAAPAATDVSPANGIPDYVDQVTAVLADVFTREVTDRGWQAPPSDGGSPTSGGDGRLDVYIDNVSCNIIAAVSSEGAISPGSRSWYSYMVLGKDLKSCYDSPGINSGPGDLSTLTPLQVIQDVIAHEYHHVIQNGINRNSSSTIKEATANWMNDEVYDDINANVRSETLGGFQLFKSPATSLDSISYGGWFWLRYLSERFGPAAVQAVWQELATAVSPSSATAMSTALIARGSSLREAWTDFAGKILAREWFREGASYPDLAASGIANAASPHNSYPVGLQSSSINHLARRYVRFVPTTPASAEPLLRISYNGPDGQDSGGTVILQTADGRRIDHLVALDGSNDGSQVVSGFRLTPPPADGVRVTSSVLAMANATAASDGLSFSYCSPDCGITAGADAAITPWGIDNGYRPPLWQTPDIWADNDGDCLPNSPGRPGCNEPDDPATTPAVEAEPAKGRANMLFARVSNLGNLPVTGAIVHFRYSPFGLGLPGPSFAEIGTATVDLAPAGDSAGGDVQPVSVSWDLTDLTFNNGGAWDVPATPAVETLGDFDHFCVKVDIELPGDVNPSNNLAQNNFGEVPPSGRTGRTAFLIANSFSSPEMARLRLASPLPRGWGVQFDGGVREGEPFLLAAGELRLIHATLIAPTAEEPPETDVVADIGLFLRGQPVGGISILAARGVGAANAGWWARQWSVHFGPARPFGSLRHTTGIGPSAAFDVLWPLGRRAAIDSRISYTRLSSTPSDYDIGDLQAGFRYALTGNPQAFWFLRAGAGVFYLVDPDSLEGGFSAGLGWSRRIASHVSLEWLGEYHRLLTTQPDLELGTLRIGVLIGF